MLRSRFLPETGEVLGHTAHWRSDGIGVLFTLNALFELVAQPSLPDGDHLPWGEETSRLSLAVEEALSLPTKPMQQALNVSDKYTKTFHSAAGAIGITCLSDSSTVL